jgi:hypothetical protein
MTSPPPNFGLRGVRGAPIVHSPGGLPGSSIVAPRRMRSHLVVVGVVGALATAFAANATYRSKYCRPQDPNNPNSIPDWCRSSGAHGHGGGYGLFGSTGHGYASSASHVSFGGFGSAGAGHGSGS